MKKNKTKVKYDREADVLSMESVLPNKIDYATEAGDFVIHFNKQDKPVLVEVLNASRIMGPSFRMMQKGVVHKPDFALA
ncbi:MAG TPA: DUF2283 domain-containing protein [Candidatus Paceibacterota bacterium]